MRILIFGGFLGSGKTTVISKFLHGLVDSGKTAAVIENEIGEVGIDDALVGEAGIKVTPLFGGCVCCQITGSLIEAVRQIRAEINPDWLVVEMTGLAAMDKIRDDFEWYEVTDMPIHTVCVADVTRFDKMVVAARPLVERQLGGADVVFVNKIDVTPPAAETLELMQQLSGALIIPIRAKELSSGELWELLNAALTKKGDAE